MESHTIILHPDFLRSQFDKICIIRKSSPVGAGRENETCLITSCSPALASYTNSVYLETPVSGRAPGGAAKSTDTQDG